MYQIGRFLQLVGLGLTGIAFLEAFRGLPERTMWTFCIAGVLVFYAGHKMMPKKS